MVKFSIVIPTFNAEKSVKKALDSIVNQTFENYEIIIIDSMSCDNTLEILYSYQLKWGKIRIISEKDKGIYDAMNKGIRLAKGEIIYFLGSDDELYSDKILEIMDYESEKDKNIDIFYGNIIRVDESHLKENRIVKPFKLYNSIFINKFQVYTKLGICHQSIFAKKETLEKGFSIDYKFAGDFNWILESIENKKRFKYVDLVIASYNINGASSDIKTLFYELRKIIIQHYGLFLGKVFTVLRKRRWLKEY